jgi:hypothetical protein
MTRDTQKDVELFSQLVSDIDISKYNQAEFREIVDDIYWNIFSLKEDSNE